MEKCYILSCSYFNLQAVSDDCHTQSPTVSFRCNGVLCQLWIPSWAVISSRIDICSFLPVPVSSLSSASAMSPSTSSFGADVHSHMHVWECHSVTDPSYPVVRAPLLSAVPGHRVICWVIVQCFHLLPAGWTCAFLYCNFKLLELRVCIATFFCNSGVSPRNS